MYSIIFEKDAAKEIKKLPKYEQVKIIKKIESLKSNPWPAGTKSLQGNLDGFDRIRIGDYRVIYKVEDKILKIYIVKVAHRKNVYDF